jgi:SpoVK/Ycf46/Vps4 family AAA+-type ATPase
MEIMTLIQTCSMNVERDIRFDLIARLCPNTTGAELRSVATEAGMFAIRARRKVASERDFLDAVEKVVRQGTKFSSTYVSSLKIHHNLLMLSHLGLSTKFTTSLMLLLYHRALIAFLLEVLRYP